MQIPPPTEEHLWLHRLVGDWTFESDCDMGGDQPSIKTTGTESVRKLGELWTVGEGTSEFAGGVSKSIMTLGFDPATGRFVGTFLVSIMAYLWPYSGSLDKQANVLTLDSEGPSFSEEGKFVRYQDIIAWESEDVRTLSSQVLNEKGVWVPFMKATYRRTN